MNIIKKIVDTPYIFHCEDDWKFFCKKRYISECFDVLGQSCKIGQCLIIIVTVVVVVVIY